MKNLINIPLEELENLPTKTYPDWRENYRGAYHRVNGYYPFTILRRVLREFTGKHVNDAFSKYCTLVPVYQQMEFWEDLMPSTYWWRIKRYHADENGIIRVNKNYFYKKKKPTYYSDDYKTEKRHKVTGGPVPNYRWSYIMSDYEDVIVSGYKRVFKSYNDKEYCRLMAEQRQRRKKQLKQLKKENENKIYVMRHPKEEDLEDAA